MADSPALPTVRWTGIAVVAGRHVPCRILLTPGADGEHTLEIRDLSGPDGPRVRVLGPGSMPVNALLRAVPDLLLGQDLGANVDFALLGVVSRPEQKPTTVSAEISLRGNGDRESTMRVRYLAGPHRTSRHHWDGTRSAERWLSDIARSVWPPTEPPSAEAVEATA